MRIDRTIFVSSTFRDLEHHRDLVKQALEDFFWLKMMEAYGAAPGRVDENIRRWVEASDVYLGILGMCYGSREKSSGISYTELEYDEAVRLKRPCLLYLIDEDHHPLFPSNVDRGNDAEDLLRFKAKVRKANHCTWFKSPEHLQSKVSKDILRLSNELGWWQPHRDPATTAPQLLETGWRIQLCAWDSPQGILNIDCRSSAEEGDDADIASSILVSRFARGNFSDLRNVLTLRPEIRNAIRLNLAVRDIDENALATAIRSSREVFTLRMLIDIAGLARAKQCVGAICEQVLYRGRQWDDDIRTSGFLMRPFLYVAGETLKRMPKTCQPIFSDYINRARTEKKWHAKATFEKALRQSETIDGI